MDPEQDILTEHLERIDRKLVLKLKEDQTLENLCIILGSMMKPFGSCDKAMINCLKDKRIQKDEKYVYISLLVGKYYNYLLGAAVVSDVILDIYKIVK